VGYVEEPVLQPWPKVTRPRTWPGSGLLTGAVVGVLILIVALLYSLGGQGEGSNHSLFSYQTATSETAAVPSAEAPLVAPVVTETPPLTAGIPTGAMPDLRAQSLAEAAATLRDMGLSYLAVEVSSAEMPVGHIVRQSLAPGSTIDPGQVVTLEVSRGP
jgi:hypothetical protein